MFFIVELIRYKRNSLIKLEKVKNEKSFLAWMILTISAKKSLRDSGTLYGSRATLSAMSRLRLFKDDIVQTETPELRQL